MEYIVPFAIVFVMGVLGVLLLRASALSSSENAVEIIIDGNSSEECLERIVISAKMAAEKYLAGARIYIRGGDDKVVNMLCRNHDIDRI